MKRVERSTDRNLPPIFTKLATKVESREMWLPIVFDGHPKNAYSPNWKWNKCSPLLLWKMALMSNISNISKTVSDSMIGSIEVEYETTPKLLIDTMTLTLDDLEL